MRCKAEKLGKWGWTGYVNLGQLGVVVNILSTIKDLVILFSVIKTQPRINFSNLPRPKRILLLIGLVTIGATKRYYWIGSQRNGTWSHNNRYHIHR